MVLVEQQDGDFYIWVEFEESDAVEQMVFFRIFGTGHLIPDGFEHVHSYIEASLSGTSINAESNNRHIPLNWGIIVL